MGGQREHEVGAVIPTILYYSISIGLCYHDLQQLYTIPYIIPSETDLQALLNL